jgi:signal transduction histidine kinase
LNFARSGGRADIAAWTDVAEVIQGTIHEFSEEAKREGIELLHGELPASSVKCPSGVLSTVLDNLTRNAIKFMDGGPVRRIELRAKSENTQVAFEVEDSGSGLPDGFERKAFQAYVRGPNANGRPGLGLGLATVRKLVTAHGGAVGVRRASPRGTIFWFTLPASREKR